MAAQPVALAALDVIAVFGLRASIISFGELYDGVSRQADPAHRRQDVDIFLRSFTVINLSVAVMLRFAKIRAHLRQSGQLFGDLDILIAATAIENDCTLLARNRKHFERIPGPRFTTPEEVLTGSAPS